MGPRDPRHAASDQTLGDPPAAPPVAPDLQTIIDVWPWLSDDTRRAVVLIVKGATR